MLFFRGQQWLTFLLILNALLVTAVHVKMKLGNNTLQRWEALTCKHKISDKKLLANCSLYFTTLQYIYNLETQRSYKRRLISRISNFLKNLSCGLKIICLVVKVDQNVYKTANKSPSIHSNEIILSNNRLKLSPWSFTQVFKKIETTMRWNCISKSPRFLRMTAEHQNYPVYAAFLTVKKKKKIYIYIYIYIYML